MPIYGYRCSNCGHEFEVLQKMSDSPLKTCPKCSGELQKKLYPAGVIFKGSGFYSTDYKGSKASSNGSDSSQDGGKSDAKPAAEPKSEAKTESKPAKSDSDN